MHATIRVTFYVTAAGSLLALFLSIWPGMLVDLLFLAAILSVLWVPVVLICIVLAAIVAYRRREAKAVRPFPWRRTVAIPIIAVVTLALLVFYVPRRAAFLLSRPAFDQTVPTAAVSEFGGASLNRRLGVYMVDEYAADPRGGVYFRVYERPDGPDVISRGFVFRPNKAGTPFGAAGYKTRHIVDDWYWFKASDDWW